MTAPGFQGVCAGLRVLDASQGIAGPYCTQLLAQQGASVIKLEPPEGDWSRGMGVRHGEHTAISLAYNRGKRSLALELKRPGAPQALQRLARTCDVVVESFRPGVASRLGLGYEALAATKPGLLYLSLSAYGPSGPYATRAGTDTVLQAFSGLMASTRDSRGTSTRIGFMVVDVLAGLYAFNALLVALRERDSGAGTGRHIHVSLMQACAAALAPQLIEASLAGNEPRAVNVPAGVYRTADGSIVITLVKESHWVALCRALDRDDWTREPRYADFASRARHADEIKAAVSAAFASRPTAAWLDKLHETGVMATPVNGLDEWLNDEHVQATGAAARVDVPEVGGVAWPRTPGMDNVRDMAADWPAVGQHGREVLREAGFDEAEIAALIKNGVLMEQAA